MGNARTTSLHERLSTELRRAVERDLIEQPPDAATYAAVYEKHGLAAKGISLTALERYGGYLRALHRNQWIREFGDVLVGEDCSPRIESLIRARLVERLTTGEDLSASELFKSALAEKSLRDARINESVEQRAAEVHEAKMQDLRRKIEAAQAEADSAAKADPAAALAKFREDVRAIYGLSG